MTIPLIKKACDNIGLVYEDIDDVGVFLRIDLDDDKFHLCIANNLGLNDEVTEKICRDKAYTHDLLGDSIKMPNSSSYLDSQSPELYLSFTKFKSHQEIVDDIIKNNQLPLVLKPNSKSMGINVFACESKEEVASAVDKIFDRNSFQYDYVLLAQKKIEIVKEFRVLTYNQEVQFIYQKDNTDENAKFEGNLSPLHFENSQAVLLDKNKDEVIYKKIKNFIQPIFNKMKLNYAGLDIAIDSTGELYLLEINSKPGFTYFVKDNSEYEVVKMFEKILADLKN